MRVLAKNRQLFEPNLSQHLQHRSSFLDDLFEVKIIAGTPSVSTVVIFKVVWQPNGTHSQWFLNYEIDMFIAFHEHKPLSHALGSGWVKEWARKWAQRSARAKPAVRSKRMSERCKLMCVRKSKWPSSTVPVLYTLIFIHSAPLSR